MITPAQFTPGRLTDSGRRRRGAGPVALATWAAVAVLAALAWFTFTARSVEIRIDPQPDRVEIIGTWMQIHLGGTHRLRPGSYTLAAAKEGFRSLEVPLEVSDQAHQVHQFQLEQLPGRLTVSTHPERGVRIAVDGSVVGTTPIEPIELAAGEHTIEASADRYSPASTIATVGGSGSMTDVELSLLPLWAAVAFDSRPQGAAVRVDGEPVGRTPVTADLLEGSRTIELRLDGYKPYRFNLGVIARQPLTARTPALEPVEGWLIVSTEPAGATIEIDDEYKGVSPLELELAPGAGYRVTASLLGHQSEAERVRIASGKTHELHLELEPEYGEIEIVAAPADAELLIDGEPAGNATQTVRLAAVPHTLEIRKAGFVPVTRELTPRPGFPQRIEVELKTEEEAREASRRPTLTTSQGQEMRLIGPARFRMGASRREPGRRANETLRDVEITRHFYLATTEVSNEQYREFRSEHRSGHLGGSSLDLDDYPVVEVTWEDAARYCNWLSARESLPPAYVERGGKLVAARPMTTGYRLPTEAEWVLATRYEGGGQGKKYPWGDSLPLPADAGNYADASARGLLPQVIAGHQDGYPATAPIDSFEPNALGLLNLGGNVAEWMHDPYSIYSSLAGGVDQDPMGPDEGEYHVIRGAGWMDATITELRLSYRDYADDARPDVGFRIARYAD